MIKALIVNRAEIDACFDSKIYYDSHPCVTNGVPLFQEPVEVLYLDLERLIKECNFTEEENKLINNTMFGIDDDYYTIVTEDIEIILNAKNKYPNGESKELYSKPKEKKKFLYEIYNEELYELNQKKLNSLCKRIKEQNDYNWKKWLETSGTIKIPNDVKYKRCKNCDKDIRTDDFRKRNDNYGDGYRPECKICESRAKKIHQK